MSEAGTLPESWLHTTLEAVTQPKRISVRPADYPALPYVGMEHVEAETIRLLTTVPASEMHSSALRFQPGDVLYGRLRPYLNKVLKPEFEGLCSPEFIVFPQSQRLESGYLQYFLNSWRFKTFASHLNTGDRPRVDWDQLKVYEFPLPPLAEQRRIVAAIEEQFTRLDAGVAALKRAQAALKRYRAAVLKAAVEGRLTAAWRAQHPDVRPASALLADILVERRAKWEANLRAKGKDPAKARYEEPQAPQTEGLPELPQGWVGATLESAICDGPTNGLYKPQAAYGQGVPILRIDDFQNTGSKSSSELRRVDVDDNETLRYSLRTGDVVINRVNSPSHLGKALLVSERNLPAIFESNMMRLHMFQDCSAAFVVWCLRSDSGRERLTQNAKWAVNQASINQQDVVSTAIPVPPYCEQLQVVAEIERRISVVHALEATIATNLKRAERLRQAILERAFTGRLVPQDPADEPASALMERMGHRQNKGDPRSAVATMTVSLWSGER